MKYRKLTENGDYAFGRGGADMHADTPEAVGQAVLTRLRLFAGEWFVDLKEGTPYVPGVLGKHTNAHRSRFNLLLLKKKRTQNSAVYRQTRINPSHN